MFTRQHYKAIAEIVNTCSGPDVHYNYQTTYTVDLVESLADYFAKNNEQFDRKKFLEACGL